jgi:acyl-CoA thioesterase I
MAAIGRARRMLSGYGARPPLVNAFSATPNATARLFRILLSAWLGCALIGLAPWTTAATAMAAPRTLRLLALGDSLTAGWGLSAQAAFPARLEQALRARGQAVAILNAGVSGDTSAGGRARLDWALSDRPDAVIVELGANDGLRGIDPEDTYRNLSAILDRLHRAHLPVLLAGMLAPPNLGPSYGEQFQRVFTRLSAEHDVVFYPFFLDGVAATPDLTQADGMHPNAKGVDVIVGRILPAVERLIARIRQGSPP